MAPPGYYYRQSEIKHLPAKLSGRLALVTIGASDFALRNFLEDAVKRTRLLHHLGNARHLIAQMIKLQDNRICLPAINTRMQQQVSPHSLTVALDLGSSLLTEALPVCYLVRLLIRPVAGRAQPSRSDSVVRTRTATADGREGHEVSLFGTLCGVVKLQVLTHWGHVWALQGR